MRLSGEQNAQRHGQLGHLDAVPADALFDEGIDGGHFPVDFAQAGDEVGQRRATRTKKFKAHDEQNACKVGDKVRIGETRPLSKEKRWEVIQILEKAAQ